MVVTRVKPKAGCKPQALSDPCGDRPMKDANRPFCQVLTADTFWDSRGQPNIQVLLEHLGGEGVVGQELLLDIVKKASEVLEAEPNLLKLSDPITVVGDIHGQFFDLVKLLEIGGPPETTQYIFLGDYVDRGSFSVEVVVTLFALKIRYPKTIRMLRGNHECRQMTSFFNFREECEYKYDVAVYEAIMSSFDMLPIGATINGKFLVVHGGISPDLPNLKAINSLHRFQEPPREGLLCDLLWSDPYEKEQAPPRSKKAAMHFVPNDVRQCSYFYTFDGAATFLKKNQLLSIIRAHEAQLEGYKMHKTNPATGFPSTITIFSAPNYCDVYNNKGAILKFDNSTLNILQLNCSPHPYHLPNFMDVFTWSMPFVIEKVTEMLYYILQPSASAGTDDEAVDPGQVAQASAAIRSSLTNMEQRPSLSKDQHETVEFARQLALQIDKNATKGAGAAEQEEEARDRMRRKVRSIARMARMFKTLRQENETIIQLKGVCPGHKLPPNLLLAGKDKLKTELDMFELAERIDSDNEQRPDEEGKPPGAMMHSSTLSARDFADGAGSDDEDKAPAGDAPRVALPGPA